MEGRGGWRERARDGDASERMRRDWEAGRRGRGERGKASCAERDEEREILLGPI